MSTFFHHPDNIIYITVPGDPDQIYTDTLANFELDVATASVNSYPGLPVGATQRSYDGIRHLVRYATGDEDDAVPWAPGDDYFTNVSDLIAAQTDRNTPNVDFDALRAAKLQEMINYYKSLVATGASYLTKQYSIRRTENLPRYTMLYSLANAAEAGDYTWDAGEEIMAIDGTQTAMATSAAMLAFGAVVLKASADVEKVYIDHEFAILSLVDNEATIAAYDVTDNWPSI